MIAKDHKSAFTQRWIIFLHIDVTEAKLISKMRGGTSRFFSIQSASYISMSLRSGSWDRCSVSACNRFWKLYISVDVVITGSVIKETRRKLKTFFPKAVTPCTVGDYVAWLTIKEWNGRRLREQAKLTLTRSWGNHISGAGDSVLPTNIIRIKSARTRKKVQNNHWASAVNWTLVKILETTTSWN